jgi:hypothetical protein
MLGLTTVTIRRFAPATVVNFKTVSTIAQTFSILASVQPIGRDVYRMDEAMRSRAKFKMYTLETLNIYQAGSLVKSDLVQYAGVWFEVHGESDYNEAAPLVHNKYILVAPEV